MSWLNDNIQPEVIDYLFNLKITLPERVGVFQRDIQADTDVDYEMLEEQLAHAPQMICFFNLLLAEQTAKVKILERKAKALRGKLGATTLYDAKVNRVEARRADITDIGNSDPAVIRVETEVILESKIQDKLEATVDACVKKFEALRSLAGFKKEDKRSV
jgi:uncharacterized coiled-coil protein SlyX